MPKIIFFSDSTLIAKPPSAQIRGFKQSLFFGFGTRSFSYLYSFVVSPAVSFTLKPNLAAIPLFSPFHTITVLQGLIRVKAIDTRPQPSPKQQFTAIRYRNRIQTVQEYEPVSLSLPPCYGED